MREKNSGFSALELLIVVSLLGILATIGFVRINPPAVRLLSGDLKAMVHQARYESVKRNQPVAFVWIPDADTFEIRIDSGSRSVPAACGGDTILSSKGLTDYPRVAVDVGMPSNGLVWLPTGQGRACNGAPMVSSEIKVVGGSQMRVLEITMGGKVSIR